MSTFTTCHSIDEIEQFIASNQLSFLYISQQNCSVCHGLEPQIKQLLENYPNIVARKVDASEVPEVAGKFSVFTAPVLLLFVYGKEYIREARFVQTAKLDEKLARIYENVIDE